MVLQEVIISRLHLASFFSLEFLAVFVMLETYIWGNHNKCFSQITQSLQAALSVFWNFKFVARKIQNLKENKTNCSSAPLVRLLVSLFSALYLCFSFSEMNKFKDALTTVLVVSNAWLISVANESQRVIPLVEAEKLNGDINPTKCSHVTSVGFEVWDAVQYRRVLCNQDSSQLRKYPPDSE